MQDVIAHLLTECLVTVSPGRLGLIEGHVGLTQQLFRRLAVPGGDSDAGGDHDRRRRAVDDERLTHHFEQSLGDQLGRDVQGGAVDEDDELVAAHSSNRVHVAQGRGQPLRDRLQQPVAGAVAKRVVDVLEAVEVEVERCAQRSVAVVSRDELPDSIQDQDSIRQSGQRIVQSLMP